MIITDKAIKKQWQIGEKDHQYQDQNFNIFHKGYKNLTRATAAMAAVSTFKTVSPNDTGMQPCFTANATSSGVKSPSGPIKIVTGFCLSALSRMSVIC